MLGRHGRVGLWKNRSYPGKQQNQDSRNSQTCFLNPLIHLNSRYLIYIIIPLAVININRHRQRMEKEMTFLG
jgi:hypothetical protein